MKIIPMAQPLIHDSSSMQQRPDRLVDRDRCARRVVEEQDHHGREHLGVQRRKRRGAIDTMVFIGACFIICDVDASAPETAPIAFTWVMYMNTPVMM